jgi:hypothetical protein
MIYKFNSFTNTVNSKLTALRVVDFIVFNLAKYFQVFNSIIRFISIYVVDMLLLLKRSTQICLHNIPMFQNFNTLTHRQINIPLFVGVTFACSKGSGKSNSTFNRTIFSNTNPFFFGAVNWLIKTNSTYLTLFSMHINSITRVWFVRNININASLT